MIYIYIFAVLFNTQIIDKNKAESAFYSKMNQPVLNQYNFNDADNRSVKLPKVLKEISGITILQGSKLFAHNDEEGKIYQIDYSSGKVLKTFSLGKNTIFEDFEDITAAGSKFFIITSNGILYRFSEGNNKVKVDYDIFETGLNKSYNIEGMCYDESTNSLLLACKGYSGKGNENSKAVYSFSLKNYKLTGKPRFLISLKELENKFGIKTFSPSAITRYTVNGNFLVLSSNTRAVIELSPDGKILAGKKLSEEVHPQPEGIAFMNDHTLAISDEQKKGGVITFYKPNK